MIQPLAGALAPLGRAAGLAPWYRAGGAPVPVIAYQPKGAASLAASYVNLANPGTYDATPVGTPTFAAATGWTFPSAYLTTGYAPPGTQTITMLVRYSGAQTINGLGVAGVAQGAKLFLLQPFRTGNKTGFWSNVLLEATPAVLSGAIGIVGRTGFVNGAAVGAAAAASQTAYTNSIWIGRYNADGSPATSFIGNIVAFALYESVLPDAQVAAVSAAMAAL